MTNLEGRILRRRRVLDPPPGVWTDDAIMRALAARLGFGRLFMAEGDALGVEFRRATAGGVADYAGATPERIDANDGLFWPCRTTHDPGTPRLFSEAFETVDGLARFHVVEHSGAAEQPDDDFPFYLTTGRVLAQYQSGTQTRRVKALLAADPEPFVEIHPETARTLGVAAGDEVRLTTRRGEVRLAARLSRDIRMDTLFVPFHWGGRGSANVLTHAALDPVSRIPEFKVCAVRLERVKTEVVATRVEPMREFAPA